MIDKTECRIEKISTVYAILYFHLVLAVIKVIRFRHLCLIIVNKLYKSVWGE
jgi:hypothetical protein